MNLFARIVSHGFAFAVVALLALGLVYRGELFPEWELPDFLALGDRTVAETADAAMADIPAPVEQVSVEETDVPADELPPPPSETGAGELTATHTDMAADTAMGAVEAPAEVPSAAAPQEETQPEPEFTVPAGSDEPALQEDPAQADAAPSAAAERAPVTSGQMSTGDFGTTSAPAVLPVETQPADEAAAAVEVAATPPETVPEAQYSEPAAPARTTPAAPVSTPYQVLAAAREAYWLRDYAVAEQKYQALIALDPDNPDGYGELGNMYFSQGDWEKASAAYFEAGTRLTSQGMYDRARQLVEVIRGLNGGQADDLETQIKSAESDAP